MPITSLRFTNVGPFDDIEFEFDPQVNVFTGPNNSGKSTALIVLGDVVVFPFSFPTKLLRSENSQWEIKLDLNGDKEYLEGPLPLSVAAVRDLYNNIGFTTFIPAQRHSTDFRALGPTVHKNVDTADETDDELMRRKSMMETNATMISNEAIIQKVVDMDYASYRRSQPAIRQLIEQIATLASEITDGFPIKFLRVGEDERGLFPQFRTPDGDVPLNVLSQGTQSIIQWLAHLLIGYAEYYDYPDNLADKPGIVIIDEIDAHLHPSWQRRIIPTLTKHFPNLQIFCSTHSPLMLAGLKEGQVQLLRRDDQGKVTVTRNQTDIVGWSADEILRIFLDVPNPTDLETSRHVERLQELRRKDQLTDEESAELEQLRHTVNQDFLGGPMARQIEDLNALLERAKRELPVPPDTAPARPSRSSRRRSSR